MGVLLILIAAILLLLGLSAGSGQLLVGSVGLSLLAAILLVFGSRQVPSAGGVADVDSVEHDGVPDEPPPQLVDAAAAARLARLSTEVLVVDGRPRYHLAECVHLGGEVSIPLAVSEAVELGFSPCGGCEPASTLLAGPRAA